jgi:hypothetical protein
LIEETLIVTTGIVGIPKYRHRNARFLGSVLVAVDMNEGVECRTDEFSVVGVDTRLEIGG